jgi:hypothetical protein
LEEIKKTDILAPNEMEERIASNGRNTENARRSA